jgi:hypothetical protein
LMMSDFISVKQVKELLYAIVLFRM